MEITSHNNSHIPSFIPRGPQIKFKTSNTLDSIIYSTAENAYKYITNQPLISSSEFTSSVYKEFDHSETRYDQKPEKYINKHQDCNKDDTGTLKMSFEVEEDTENNYIEHTAAAPANENAGKTATGSSGYKEKQCDNTIETQKEPNYILKYGNDKPSGKEDNYSNKPIIDSTVTVESETYDYDPNLPSAWAVPLDGFTAKSVFPSTYIWNPFEANSNSNFREMVTQNHHLVGSNQHDNLTVSAMNDSNGSFKTIPEQKTSDFRNVCQESAVAPSVIQSATISPDLCNCGIYNKLQGNFVVKNNALQSTKPPVNTYEPVPLQYTYYSQTFPNGAPQYATNTIPSFTSAPLQYLQTSPIETFQTVKMPLQPRCRTDCSPSTLNLQPINDQNSQFQTSARPSTSIHWPISSCFNHSAAGYLPTPLLISSAAHSALPNQSVGSVLPFTSFSLPSNPISVPKQIGYCSPTSSIPFIIPQTSTILYGSPPVFANSSSGFANVLTTPTPISTGNVTTIPNKLQPSTPLSKFVSSELLYPAVHPFAKKTQPKVVQDSIVSTPPVQMNWCNYTVSAKKPIDRGCYPVGFPPFDRFQSASVPVVHKPTRNTPATMPGPKVSFAQGFQDHRLFQVPNEVKLGNPVQNTNRIIYGPILPQNFSSQPVFTNIKRNVSSQVAPYPGNKQEFRSSEVVPGLKNRSPTTFHVPIGKNMRYSTTGLTCCIPKASHPTQNSFIVDWKGNGRSGQATIIPRQGAM